MRYYVLSVVVLGAALVSHDHAAADATIQFQVRDGGDGSTQNQTAYISNGAVLIKQAGGDVNVDLLYRQASESMTVIDHSEKTYMTIDEAGIGKLADQAAGVMSAVQQQLAQQLANMPPEQAARMREMMGGFGLEAPDEQPPKAAKLVAKGTKTVNGFECRQHDVLQGNQKTSELCLADPKAVGLSDTDYAVVKSMQEMGARMAERAKQFSRSFGNKMPDLSIGDIKGVPVEMRDLSEGTPSSMTVTEVTDGVGKIAMNVPEGYVAKPLPTMPNM